MVCRLITVASLVVENKLKSMWALKFKLVKARLLNPVIPVREIYPTNILGYVAFNHVWQHPVIAKDRKQFMFLNLLLLFSPKVISDPL